MDGARRPHRPGAVRADPAEAEKLRDALRHIDGALAIETGPSFRGGEHTLTIGR